MTLSGVITILTAALITPPLMLAAAAWSLFDRSGNGPHQLSRFWARTLVRASRVKVALYGLENLDRNGTYIFAANHTSVFDILVLMGYLPYQIRWMAKEELFRIPFFGPMMARLGHIPVNRTNPREGLESLKRAAARIRGGASVIIFPEGTRSEDGMVAPFKRGGFVLAAWSGRPVAPVSISGAHRVLQTRTLKLKPGPIAVRLGRPIPPGGPNRAGQEKLAESVRQAVIQRLDPVQQNIFG